MTMHRLWPWLLLAVSGLLGLAACAVYVGASLPYPDPTPELLAKQQQQMQAASVCMGVALVLGVVGVSVHLLRFWRHRHRL